MQQEYIELLEQQWLSEKESQVYLALLELGSAPASTVARRTGIKRVTVYGVLKELESKQIASSLERKWITYFQVIDPLKLLQKVKEKYELLSEKVPELLAFTNVYNNKPKIEYFEGFQGMVDTYEDLLSSQVAICSFLGMGTVDKAFEEYLFDEFLPRRVAKKIFANVIVAKDEGTETYIGKKDKEYYKETRVVERQPFSLSTEINLYGPGKVGIVLFSSDEMSSLVIQSSKLYDSLLNIFNVLREHSTWSTSTSTSSKLNGRDSK